MTLFIYPPQDFTVPNAATEAKQDDIIAEISTLNSNLIILDGHVDGIEGLISTTNSEIVTLNSNLLIVDGHIDGIEALISTTNGYVDGIESALSTLNSKDFATESTLAKIKKWPYATHNTIEPTEDATNEYYTYKNSGGTTVGTITKVKATGIITYSPDKVY
jgi:hypothetical protein